MDFDIKFRVLGNDIFKQNILKNQNRVPFIFFEYSIQCLKI